jgi:hypothetical protein
MWKRKFNRKPLRRNKLRKSLIDDDAIQPIAPALTPSVHEETSSEEENVQAVIAKEIIDLLDDDDDAVEIFEVATPTTVAGNDAEEGEEDEEEDVIAVGNNFLEGFTVVNANTAKLIKEQIRNSAYVSYLMKLCSKTKKRADDMVSRAVKILTIIFKLADILATDFYAGVREVIRNQYHLLEPCARHFRVTKHLAAGTVCDYIMDGTAYLTWFSLFSPDRRDITNADMAQLDHVSKILQKEFRRQVSVAPLQ